MNLLDGFECIKCRGENFEHVGDYLECRNCEEKFPVVNNIPIVISKERSIFKAEDFLQKKNLFFKISKSALMLRKISGLLPPNSYNWSAQKNFSLLSDLLKKKYNSKTLVIGGSVIGRGFKKFLKQNESTTIIESDVSYGPRTKIIFDCHDIPYKDETFDCVIVQAVLEHVVDPQRCVAEIFRVLKFDGYVYAETPFMQHVHGGPFDFTRYTHSGHRRLFRNFEEIRSGITAGAGSVMLWSYEYLLLSIFGINNTVRLAIKAFARITGFFLPYLDFLTMWNKKSKDAASGLYFLGRKSNRVFEDSKIIEYYDKITH